MANPLPHPDSGDDSGLMPGRGSTATYPGTPRWVKVSGIIALALVLLLVGMRVAGAGGGGGHGPARHAPSGGPGGHTPPMTHGVQRP